MKKNISLRSLTLISLIIFSFPFLQTCSNKKIKDLPYYKSEFAPFTLDTLNIDANQTEIANFKISKKEENKLRAQDKIDKEKWFIEMQNEWTLNAYKIGFLESIKDFEIDFLKDIGFYISLCFFLFIFASGAMFILSFTIKYNTIFLLAILNLALLICATLLSYFGKVLDEFSQIKYGYYLFILNSILIIMISKKKQNLKKKNSL
jgi:hypothetical protein